MNPRHLRNSGASPDVNINVVGFEDFIIDHDSVRRLKAGMTSDDLASLESSQPFFYALVRPFGDCILSCFDAFRIDTHIAAEAEPVFTTSASNVGRVGARNECLGRDASRVHASTAKLV